MQTASSDPSRKQARFVHPLNSVQHRAPTLADRIRNATIPYVLIWMGVHCHLWTPTPRADYQQTHCIFSASKQQRMLIQIHGYNFTMTHRPGSHNQLADGLSRLPSPDNVATIDLDVRVDLVRVSKERLDKVSSDTSLDAVLNQLVETIIAGRPEDVNDLPPEFRSFWSFRDQLPVNNRLIVKGQLLVILRMQQPERHCDNYTLLISAQRRQGCWQETRCTG